MEESYGVQRETAGATPTMIRVIRICRKCGAKIFSDAPEGLCTRCVLKTALVILPDTVVPQERDDPAALQYPARSPGRFSARTWCKALQARRKKSWRRTSGKF